MACPDAGELRQLALGSLEPGPHQRVTEHLRVCERCHNALASLAAAVARQPEAAIPGVDVGHILKGRQVARERPGLLSRMTAKYVALAHRLGNDHWPIYDSGTFALSDVPRYFIYTVDDSEKRLGPLEVAHTAAPRRAGAFIR